MTQTIYPAITRVLVILILTVNARKQVKCVVKTVDVQIFVFWSTWVASAKNNVTKSVPV